MKCDHDIFLANKWSEFSWENEWKEEQKKSKKREKEFICRMMCKKHPKNNVMCVQEWKNIWMNNKNK